ncbi:PH domain-containing protein [Staphylococcus sp. NRL 16/872]|uniref:PH domain-containing protein n=1 Tax=Staphylococcus sp. NRL 16/872 TaxID=2930131 RepID=UPI001FB1E10D|nr:MULTISPECIES: PH domain-containing protein [unclassified Staphylococcus]MCJ1655936.1 PH domain-containing protein [Staphylococcus sp. NRL 21/187]MCJ1661733.1 PH domain-containing protein [Staphylococcus sp. NRL 18/288]MCJ1667672.1 PH domain-containing protein [Staphylococcus sp. NRL 19/737]WEN70161.1 PH domain-containing protein [Staphylococcus sp. NRL 16/872]
MYNPQKLHPISYVSGLIKVIKQNIFPFIIFIVFNSWDFDFTNIRNYISPAIFLLIFLVTFIHQFLEVYVTRYWIEDEQFIVTSGWLNKKRKELNINRIQSLDTTQGLVDQMVGGVSLQIKTPSDGIELATISKKQSDLIDQTIREHQLQLKDTDNEAIINHERSEIDNQHTQYNHKTTSEALKNETMIYKMSWRSLLLMAMTSGAIGVALATVSPILGVFQHLISWEDWTSKLWNWIHSVLFIVLFIIIVVLVISYIIGTVITINRYYNYTVTQQDSQLKIKYGLLNVKNITVPTNRLQAVLEKQSFIRKLFGYTSIHFIITSDLEISSNEDVSDDGKIMILPFIKRKEAYQIINTLVPEMQFNNIKSDMPWRGYHRHFLIPSIILIIMACFGTYYWSAWSMVIAILIIGLMALHAYIYIRAAGLNFKNNEIALREVSTFSFKTYYFKTNKIIGMETTQHHFLERAQLENITFLIAKGALFEVMQLKFMDENKVNQYIKGYLRGDYNE